MFSFSGFTGSFVCYETNFPVSVLISYLCCAIAFATCMGVLLGAPLEHFRLMGVSEGWKLLSTKSILVFLKSASTTNTWTQWPATFFLLLKIPDMKLRVSRWSDSRENPSTRGKTEAARNIFWSMVYGIVGNNSLNEPLDKSIILI